MNKIKTIFNKNHILFEFNSEEKSEKEYLVRTTKSTLESQTPWISYRSLRKKEKPLKTKIRKESPLGFWYEKEQINYYNNSKSGLIKTERIIYIINFYFNHGTYTLSFPLKYGGQTVNSEMRPWELFDNKSLPDHYIDDLKKDLDVFFSENKLTEESNHKYKDGDWMIRRGIIKLNPLNWKEFQRSIYTSLFGFPEGPKHQTDREKIESHGFDFKTSFRK